MGSEDEIESGNLSIGDQTVIIESLLICSAYDLDSSGKIIIKGWGLCNQQEVTADRSMPLILSK